MIGSSGVRKLTDYLEQLLREQEREDETRAPEWFVLDRTGRAGRAAPADRGPETAGGEQAGPAADRSEGRGWSGEPDGESAAAPRETGTGAGSDSPGRVWPDPPQAVGTPRLRGVGEPSARGRMRAAGGAEVLYQRLRRSAAQAAYVRPAAPVYQSLGTAPAREIPAGLTPQGLDRVFQRDARRYDGGFTLY